MADFVVDKSIYCCSVCDVWGGWFFWNISVRKIHMDDTY